MANIRITSKEAVANPTGTEEFLVGGASDQNITTSIMLQDRLLSKSVAGASDVTLTLKETLYGQITLTGALTGHISVEVQDSIPKSWVVYNNTSGSYNITFKTETGTGIVVPQGRKWRLTSDGTNVYTEDTGGVVPVGSIIAFNPGYFTDGANAGFTTVVSANTAAGVNGYVGPNFKVCDGSALNDSESPIFNGASRYLPNLTDDRFIMGDTAVGNIGGSSTMAHTHTGPSHTHTGPSHTHTGPSHTHTIGSHTHFVEYVATSPTAGGSAVILTGQQVVLTDSDPYMALGGNNIQTAASSGNTGSEGTGNTSASGTDATGASGTGVTSAASDDENRPVFLSCFYIMRIK